MPRAGRIGDVAQRSEDEQVEGSGGPALTGAAGSPDVIIDHHAALREGDLGHDGWQAGRGSKGVFINGKPAFRLGDETLHGDAKGELVEGSAGVIIGDTRGGKPRERAHDRSLSLDVTDALGRPIHDVLVSVFCPHDQREDMLIHGSTTIDGLCSGSTVSVHKPLQIGGWDENATPLAAHAHHGFHFVVPDEGSPGGAPAAKKKIVHAPAKAGTAGDQHSAHLVRAAGDAQVTLTTVHNWVELVYRAFGHHIPTGPKDLVLLGVREASLAPHVAGEHLSVDELEAEAAKGDLEAVDFTREHKAPAYNDLLFCVWTDKNVHTRQHVEVFECSIDASPGQGLLHLPFLTEGQLLHARPGAYNKHYPGKDVALHVFHGMHEHHEPPGTTAEKVIAVAMKERGTVETPVNRQKYGAWYGDNGAYWCAQFVSWVFAHAGMDVIHYEGCEFGANQFQSGLWGSWHGGKHSHAEPGDIVFYNFPGEDVYDHTGIVVKDHGATITTIEGNTSPPGGSGSQSNGGGVYLKSRDKDDTIIGFGRPKYRKPHHEPGSFIRWGGEGGAPHGKSIRGSTLLHHHYFKKDHKGHQHADPAAARYHRFMHIYNTARNEKHIPYLIVSSRYVRSYTEWMALVGEHPAHKHGAKSVILEEGLHSPGGHSGHYIPSFLGPAYVERVLEHARHMHDHAKAHKLREALMGALFQLSI